MKLTAASAPAVAAALALAASQPINGQPAVHDSVFVTSADVSSSAVAGVDKPRSTVTLTVTAEATKPTSTGSIQAANKAKQEANSTTTVTASVMVIAPSSTASEEPAKTNKPADFAAGSRRSTAKSKRHTLNRADGASGMVRVRRSASASSSSSSAQQSLADTSSLIKDVRPSARASAGVLRRVWLALRAADEAQDVAAPENHGHTSEHVHSYDYEREHERHGGHRYGYETPYTTVTTTRTRTHTYWQQAKPTSRPAAAKMQPPANDAAPEADSPDAPADDDSTAEDLRKRLVTVHSHVDNVASSDTQAEVDADADDGAFVSDADTEDGLHINFLSANDQDNDLQNEEFVTRADESEEDDCDADADDFDELEGQDRVFRRAESSQAQANPETLGKRQGESSKEDFTSEQRAAMEGLVRGLQGSIIGDSSQGLDALSDPDAVFNGVRPVTNYGNAAASALTGALSQAFPGLSASQLSGVANALQQSLGTSPLGSISSGVTGQLPPALSGLGNGANTAQNQAANIAAQLASLLSGAAPQASWPLSNTLQQGYSPLAIALGGLQGPSGGLSSLTNALPGLAQSVPVSSTINPQLSSLVGSLPQQAAQVQQAAQLPGLQALLGSSNALGRTAPVQQAPQLSPAELSKLQGILGSASAGQASQLGAKLSAQDFLALPASLDPNALSALLGSASVGGLAGGANAGLPTALSGILGTVAAPSSILGSLAGGLPLASGLLGSGSLPATLPSSLENLLPTQSVASKTPGLASLTPEVIEALQSALQGAATTGASGPNWTPADAAAAAAQSVANAEAQAEDGEPPLIDAADLAAASANPGLLSPAQLQTLKEQPLSSNTTQNVQNATATPTASAGASSKTADSAYQFAAKSLPLPGLASGLSSGLSLDPATIAALASKGVDVDQLGQLTQLGLRLDASTIRALASKGINVGSLTSLLTPNAVTGPLSNAQGTLNGLPLVGGQLSGVLNQGQGAVAGASGLLSGLTGSQASGLLSGILGKLPLNLKDQQAKEGNLTEAAGSQMAFGASTASSPASVFSSFSTSSGGAESIKGQTKTAPLPTHASAVEALRDAPSAFPTVPSAMITSSATPTTSALSSAETASTMSTSPSSASVSESTASATQRIAAAAWRNAVTLVSSNASPTASARASESPAAGSDSEAHSSSETTSASPWVSFVPVTSAKPLAVWTYHPEPTVNARAAPSASNFDLLG